MDITKHGDFKEYYDIDLKVHVWVLGYFGGGEINVVDSMKIAQQYAQKYGVSLESVNIAEIEKSRSFKYFKYIKSSEEQQPSKTADIMENVFQWLTD